MQPLTVITGIVLGSCLSIAVSLAAVLLVYLFLGDEYPRVQREFWPLVTSLALFLGMTTISAASFYARVTNHTIAPVLQLLMWAGIGGVAWYYWP